MTPAQCRLAVLRARNAPVAVVLRRGPSKHTLVLRWDLTRHTFDEGHWFAGRLYPERCDLSPDGAWMVYFAAKFKGPIPTYTALSRPPWLTAHALWPELGTWSGGGVFVDPHTLALNRVGGSLDSALDHALPAGLRLAYRDASGPGPTAPARGLGWRVAALDPRRPREAPVRPSYPAKPPQRLVRDNPRVPGLLLEEIFWGCLHPGAPFAIRSHHLVFADPSLDRALGDVEWADWLDDGSLVFARRGALFLQQIQQLPRDPTFATARCLIDLAPRTFARRRCPPEAAPRGPTPGRRARG